MNNKENKQRFIHFLKKNNAYEKYMNNVKKLSPKFSPGGVFRGIHINNLISSAFIWEASEEGQDYWEILSKKWESELVELSTHKIFKH